MYSVTTRLFENTQALMWVIFILVIIATIIAGVKEMKSTEYEGKEDNEEQTPEVSNEQPTESDPTPPDTNADA